MTRLRGKPPWAKRLSGADWSRLAGAGFGQRMGPGQRPALLVIDVQNYMTHVPGGEGTEYPSSCGTSATMAVHAISRLVGVARSCGVPVFFTKFEVRRDGKDMGVYGLKRRHLAIEGWCLEGSEGAQIDEAVRPESGDFVLVKKKPSAFWGTPLLGFLVSLGIDTVVVTGGSTSNCVRATVVDSCSYNLRTLVPYDCVFDRVSVSHEVALCDLERQYADVVHSRDVRRLFVGLRRSG